MKKIYTLFSSLCLLGTLSSFLNLFSGDQVAASTSSVRTQTTIAKSLTKKKSNPITLAPTKCEDWGYVATELIQNFTLPEPGKCLSFKFCPKKGPMRNQWVEVAFSNDSQEGDEHIFSLYRRARNVAFLNWKKFDTLFHMSKNQKVLSITLQADGSAHIKDQIIQLTNHGILGRDE